MYIHARRTRNIAARAQAPERAPTGAQTHVHSYTEHAFARRDYEEAQPYKAKPMSSQGQLKDNVTAIKSLHKRRARMQCARAFTLRRSGAPPGTRARRCARGCVGARNAPRDPRPCVRSTLQSTCARRRYVLYNQMQTRTESTHTPPPRGANRYKHKPTHSPPDASERASPCWARVG